jgi:hypothetical protein
MYKGSRSSMYVYPRAKPPPHSTITSLAPRTSRILSFAPCRSIPPPPTSFENAVVEQCFPDARLQ